MILYDDCNENDDSTAMRLFHICEYLLNVAEKEYCLDMRAVIGVRYCRLSDYERQYCVCFLILIMLPSGEGNGEAAIVFKDIKHSDIDINWPVIMMCAATISLASAMTKDVTGIMPWLTDLFAPLIEGKSSVFILVFIVVVMEILTNVGSNIAMRNAMIPVVAPFVMSSGANPMIFGAALIYCCNMGMIFPDSSAPASIYHGRGEIPDSKKRTLAAAFGIGLHMVVSVIVYSVALLITN